MQGFVLCKFTSPGSLLYTPIECMECQPLNRKKLCMCHTVKQPLPYSYWRSSSIIYTFDLGSLKYSLNNLTRMFVLNSRDPSFSFNLK